MLTKVAQTIGLGLVVVGAIGGIILWDSDITRSLVYWLTGTVGICLCWIASLTAEVTRIAKKVDASPTPPT
jgi:hypothetical protein